VTSGVKTALIVAGSAVGALVLFKLFAPPPATIRREANTGLANLGGIGNLVTGLASLGGSLFGGSHGDASVAGGTYNANTTGFTVQGNSLLDASGNAVTYGTDY